MKKVFLMFSVFIFSLALAVFDAMAQDSTTATTPTDTTTIGTVPSTLPTSVGTPQQGSGQVVPGRLVAM
ncbi:MAG: hypothetical protein Q8Q95_00480 [bacterium]|nr:hypothetical protein [bacterium]